MRVLLAGGTGFLGSTLVHALRQDGHQVAILTRRPRDPQHIAWAPPSSPPPPSAIEQADVVINLAGDTIGRRWTPARKAAIRASRVAATRALAEAIRAARRPPGVLLSASAVGIYGLRGDETLTEESAAGDDFLARICVEWEAEARVAAASTRVVLLRSGVVLAREGGALPQLARPFWFLVGGPAGSGRQYVSWIHRDDWVAMVRWAIANDVSGPLNVTAPQPVTNREMAQTLGRVLRRPAVVPAPAAALRLLLGEMADALILNGQRVVPARALALGFRFRHPALDGALRAIYGT